MTGSAGGYFLLGGWLHFGVVYSLVLLSQLLVVSCISVVLRLGVFYSLATLLLVLAVGFISVAAAQGGWSLCC